MTRLLRAIAAAGTRRPWLVILLSILVAALASLYASRAMRIETDLVKFLPDDPTIRAFDEARKIAREPGTLFALFEIPPGGAADERADASIREPGEALLAFADAWAISLRASGVATSVEYEVPPIYERFVREVLASRGFLYLEGADLEEALARLEPSAIRAEIDAAGARLQSAAPVQLARLVAGDPLGLVRIFSRRMTRGIGAFRIDTTSGALLSPDRRALLAKVVGKGGAGDLAYAKSLMEALARAEDAGRAAARGAEIDAGYTGGYAIAIEDERSIKRDVYLTVGSSVVCVLGIFIAAFRRGRAFVYASAPLVIGIAVGFAAFVAIRRDVTVASAAFVSVVVGLAVDFPIHLLARYLRERRAWRPLAEANEAAVVSTGGGALAAGLMTGAAFLSFGLTGFRGLADLGIMAGLCMLGSLAATLVLFPALTAAIGAREERRGVTGFGLEALWSAVDRHPRAIVGAGLAATIASAALLAGPGGPVALETDLRNLRPRGARALEVQAEIAKKFGGSFDVALAILHAPDEEQALAALGVATRGLERLRERQIVAGWESPEPYLPSRVRQEAVLARLAAVDPERVTAALREALAANGFKVAAFEGTLAKLREQLRPAIVTRESLAAAGLGELLDALVPPRPGTAEPWRALVKIFPREQGWDEAERRAFVAAVEAEMAAVPPPADVRLTGVFAVVATLVERLRRDFVVATVASIAIVSLIALGHFRRLGDACLATAPVILGLGWMFAFMKVADIPINFMNVIVFPMVIGIEDNAVHVLHRYRERGAGSIRTVLDETGLALFLCTATTMLGFGSLVLSSNRGLASIGAVTLVAKATCWATSTVLMPAWLRMRETHLKRN